MKEARVCTGGVDTRQSFTYTSAGGGLIATPQQMQTLNASQSYKETE